MLAAAKGPYNTSKKEDFTNLYGKELLSHSGRTNSKIRKAAAVCLSVA